MSDHESSSNDSTFEIIAALLLGIGAIATAVASWQNGLWGGESLEKYSDGTRQTAAASSTYSDEIGTYIQDALVDIRAKEHIWEASETEDDEDKKRRLLEMASWLYSSQLSDAGFKSLELPEKKRAERDAKGEEVPYTEAELQNALEIDLDSEEYRTNLFAESEREFDDAEANFNLGRSANQNGDLFSFATVILAIGMFFAGISLTFKTGVRWGFLGAGALILIGGIGMMATFPWKL